MVNDKDPIITVFQQLFLEQNGCSWPHEYTTELASFCTASNTLAF